MNNSTEPNIVSLSTLRDAFTAVLAQIGELQGDEVRLDSEFFWSIPTVARYDMTQEPTDLTIGQISESIENLQRIAADPSWSTQYALTWLADVLCAIASSDDRPNSTG